MRWLALLVGMFLAVPARGAGLADANDPRGRSVSRRRAGGFHGPARRAKIAGEARRDCRRREQVRRQRHHRRRNGAAGSGRRLHVSRRAERSRAGTAGRQGRALRSRRRLHADCPLWRGASAGAGQSGRGAGQDHRRSAAGDPQEAGGFSLRTVRARRGQSSGGARVQQAHRARSADHSLSRFGAGLDRSCSAARCS